jgi:hypothetical protein
MFITVGLLLIKGGKSWRRLSRFGRKFEKVERPGWWEGEILGDLADHRLGE